MLVICAVGKRFAVTTPNQPVRHAPWEVYNAPSQNIPACQLLDATARIRELEAQLAVRDLSSDSGPRERTSSDARSDNPWLALFAVDHLQDTYSIDTSLATFQAEIAHCGVGESGSTKRASFSSIVYRKTGAQLDLDHFLAQAAQSLRFRGIQSRTGSHRSLSPKWPPTPLVRYSIDHYSQSGLYSIFPVASADGLSRLIEEGILDRQDETVPAANLACLFALTAMMSVMHRLSPEFVNAEPDAYIQAALGLMPRLLMERTTVRSLEAVVLIMTYVMPSGQIEPGQLLLSLATRMILTLGAHRMSIMSKPEGRHLRALFWFCYGADKNMLIRYNQSPHFIDADCDLQIPDNYVLSSSDNQFFSRPLSNHELLFPSDVRLSLLKSKVYHLLYSRHARAHSEARRLQYIRELDQELNDLKRTFPASCWPDLFATSSAPNYTFHDLRKIHEASPCLESNNSISSWSILPSSVELFYQESRSILLYIRHVRDFLNWHTFWIYAQFLLTSVFSLFKCIISYPAASSNEKDIQLLQSLVDMFAELDGKESENARGLFPPFYFTVCLIKRLIFLARQASNKACE
ncbi:fungal specific transcription factor domain-containing protein [Aspergillus tubingensis]|uniref:C6 transcription factor n=1 Tax=Aspergillus niger TaxID=5061 RepID=A0A100IU69_ASPNG|nr:C6 transcription factor [Aspergillus tubingensis]GAQ47409.1 C6 transcription factor [Aspergillus niger]GFN11422.1 C6 transcription factor [Aspergillus tubingensis]